MTSNHNGRVKIRDALVMIFTARARQAAKRGNTESIHAIILKNLSKDGGSVPTVEPTKESDPNIYPQG